MKNAQQRKSVKKWVLLLMMPIVALILVALAQLIVRFVLASSTNVTDAGLETQSSASIITLVINIFSILVGALSLVALLLTPLWLVMLVHDLKGYERSKTIAIVLAVFFGHFSWIYTFEKNYMKFWINLGLSVVTAGVWSPVAWLWAVIDNASKPKDYYTGYNKPKQTKS